MSRVSELSSLRNLGGRSEQWLNEIGVFTRADLEKIGSSFEGVTATYILSAGREVRVMVDGHRVDDHKALNLSKQIAQKIEEELNYPGLIKVTVVRETQAVEFAR